MLKVPFLLLFGSADSVNSVEGYLMYREGFHQSDKTTNFGVKATEGINTHHLSYFHDIAHIELLGVFRHEYISEYFIFLEDLE